MRRRGLGVAPQLPEEKSWVRRSRWCAWPEYRDDMRDSWRVARKSEAEEVERTTEARGENERSTEEASRKGENG